MSTKRAPASPPDHESPAATPPDHESPAATPPHHDLPGATPATEPRWLTAAEQRVWRSFLSATQMLGERLDQELTRDSGMPHTYYEVLVRLSEVPGRRLRMSELADRSMSSRSRLSHAVSRLEENGWVRRESCPTDRRGQVAVLTDAGFAALAAAAPGHVEGVRTHLFDALTPQQVEQLGEICAAVADRLRESCTYADLIGPADTDLTDSGAEAAD